MHFAVDDIIRLIAGNVSYTLLVLSMVMTSMFWLRVCAIAAGVAGTAYSLFWLKDWVFTFWDGAFLVVNVVQMVLLSYRNAAARLSGDERIFHEFVVPTLEPRLVRKLVQTGAWHRAEPGTVLIRQGETVPHLLFMRSGRVNVLVNGTSVGDCGIGSIIGEISVFTGEPATATVVASESMRYLALEREALHKLTAKDSEIAAAINAAVSRELGDKLVRVNVQALGPAVATG